MEPMTMELNIEVLETKPLNELLSEAIIKVCWVDPLPNPNHTVITKEVGKNIAATLPGAPIVGYYNREEKDFVEHSTRTIVSNGQVFSEDLTKSYGFVDPTSNPWYQDFQEDGKIRTYLMCKAYLWTRQYEEAREVFGKGQSMELNEDTMSGYSQDKQNFVFTYVELDKLCILGDNYEPCFPGAQILSKYAKQYANLADELEKTLGRRYYVMDGKLVEKPEAVATSSEVTEATTAPFSLDYAVALGWNLNDAVYVQLQNRGAGEKYSVEGIYAEAGGIFVILQERETLEFVRCELVITAADTVELGTEMIAVRQSWVVKPLPTPAPTEPLNGEAAVPAQEIPMNVAATYSEGSAEIKAEELSETTSVTKSETEYSADNKVDNKETDTVPATNFSTSEIELNFPGNVIESNTVIPPETVPPQVNYSLKISELEQKLAETTLKLAEYAKQEETKIVEKKQELVTAYSAILTDEEMAPVIKDLTSLTVDEVETKFALAHSRKARTSPATAYQVDVNKLPADDNAGLPDFMVQAMELDKASSFSL